MSQPQKQKLIPHQNQNNQKLSFSIKFIFYLCQISHHFFFFLPRHLQMSLATPLYYMVSFTSKLNSDITSDEYTQVADLMVSLAKQQPGFLGLESTRDPTSKIGITISYWKDKSSIQQWKQQSDHQLAQKLGKSKFYDYFKVRIALVERDYQFEGV
ncbi:hypothetical protein W5Q_05491 [Candida albicans SC5314]|uniref:ABM domain-containing protein n=1 Tax=Candida albicans (strain SC5314 / ATCC MYA-2876) TaxID=237561 RepID=A0A1D8PRM8_CANAL|nr:uncharacterized protein CAALFM_CR00270CA [Candida albicans SC5314]KGQ81379.1 hypothetical protein MEO_05359 [Candida albicans P94015]KGT64610.1 hypothetical protein MEK_05391 [Candida albicans 12C]KHC46126.1 hypothetical protein MGC_05374 [Candida albicans P37039]AOW30798.1 hypothetical protein CAALFM_CR00270CA [Candida albicans SC5314]KHC71010.1 hypothetical protein W5Q_05491 [Candida albicans SC5314]|eukprot:XP_718664.1 hypothetical protein CAALFM_CR00270CA [Candida albicans SC5314]